MAERRRLKIALVGLTYPFRGGIAHYTTLLCRALRERHDVRFFALYRQYPSLLFPGKTQMDESDDSFNIDHEATIDSINPVSWFRTASRIVDQRPDLIVVSWWHPFFAPAFGTIARLARRKGIPTCYLCHNAVPHERSAIDKALLQYAFSAAPVFITHSKQDHDDLKALKPDAIVHQNPHPTYDVFATDEPLTPDEAKRRIGLAGKRLLLFFGFVREYKGLAHLLDAVRRLGADEGYHLAIVGEFYDDKSKYQSALEELTSRGQITLVDRYVPNEEVAVYFTAADLVMVPYLSATQSGVIQIAYAFLKPVIATTVGGIPEVVTDGRTGYLVPPADADALASAAQRYFAEDRREQFEREIVEENEKYSWDRMVETIERACAELNAR